MEAAIREAVLSTTADISMQDRYNEFLNIFAKATGSDACALLRYQDDALVPISAYGFKPEVLEQTFSPQQNPRFAAITQSRRPVRFTSSDPRTDPYAGMRQHAASSGSCIGCGLYNENALFGVLLADALQPGAFEHIDDSIFLVFAAIATVSLRYETNINKLEKLARHRELVANELVNEALRRSNPTLGESQAMQDLNTEIDIVAKSDLSVLILGETGVGKEVVARIIHARSLRAEQPLVYVNCAALPEALAESELFGHVRGAYSGANNNRAGKFELANGGTLFLDEVGELPLAIQAKLLRAVQFGEIQRLGSDGSHQVDVRIIAATNRRLDEEVKSGRFRADLYHRLSVYPLNVPPLRERLPDVVYLARFFLDQARVRIGLERACMSLATIKLLKAYDWPGNVRELEHVILRAVLRAASNRGQSVVLEPDDLDIAVEYATQAQQPGNPQDAVGGITLMQAVNDFQRQLVLAAFIDAGENWAEAARRLGVDRGNLHRLAKRLAIK